MRAFNSAMAPGELPMSRITSTGMGESLVFELAGTSAGLGVAASASRPPAWAGPTSARRSFRVRGQLRQALGHHPSGG
jgi:hypothetical protein